MRSCARAFVRVASKSSADAPARASEAHSKISPPRVVTSSCRPPSPPHAIVCALDESSTKPIGSKDGEIVAAPSAGLITLRKNSVWTETNASKPNME
jgi:hypothetical protein